MGRAGAGRAALFVALLLGASACARAAGDEASIASAPDAASAARTPATTAAPGPPPRPVVEEQWTPYATVGGVTLVHPSNRVERIGFHEANHDGARQQDPLATAVAPATLETRHRETGSRTAADVVVDPAAQIRSPVTGTVKWAGSYILYCTINDNYVVIEPDEHPGWEVKVLHIDGLLVHAGQRVVAGQTPIAASARQLPLESQVDKLRIRDPAWPHVHIEVVDPTIPDRPSPGGGCP